MVASWRDCRCQVPDQARSISHNVRSAGRPRRPPGTGHRDGSTAGVRAT